MFKRAIYKALASLNYRSILRDPVKFTITLGAALLLLLVKMSWAYYFDRSAGFIMQILAELHGLVFDIFIIGILMVWINRLSEKRRVIEFCKQQIDDLRSLRSEYVSLKIMSCIKILNRYKIFEIDLSGVSIPNAPMNKINLSGSDLNGFECPKASLIFAKLNRCTMNGSVFDRADLFQADLCNVSANGASFNTTNLSRAQLCNSKFITASFRNCYLNGASFSGSNLLSADFEGAHLLDVDFSGCKELRIEQLHRAKIFHNCRLDDNLIRELNALRSQGVSSSSDPQ